MEKRLVMALSGGMDSTALYVRAKSEFSWILPVFFNYGQKHSKELNSARAVVGLFDDKLFEVSVDLSFLQKSALVNHNKDLVLESSDYNGLPSTFVPGRNILFSTILASLAYENKANYIGIGVNFEDINGYPDCRLNTLQSFERTISLALDKSMNIYMPFVNMTKTEILQETLRQEKGLEAHRMSWSCYEGGDVPCGTCKACKLRIAAESEVLGDR